MLRTNLSTRPFYNARAVHLMLGAAVLIVLVLTLFNLVRGAGLAASEMSLGASAGDAEREAARLRAEAARIRSQINPQELEVVSNAAREANAIIDQRAFSWTDLFTQFEATLPPDVRITAVQPKLQKDGAFVVSVGVDARRAEDLDAFVEALEDGGHFRNVLSTSEQATADGLLQAIVEGTYVPGSERPAPVESAR